MSNLPTINAFWAGPRMGRMHAACLQSFARQGHRVVLHTYSPPPEDAPQGVEIADANVFLNSEKIIRHRASGSLALASDLFRYEMMAAGAGIYVDCDCYCVRPLDDADYIFGWESDFLIANGVMRLPADSELLVMLRSIGSTRSFIPPWAKPSRQRRYQLRAKLGWPVPLSNMKLGTTGPDALTHYVKKLGLTDMASPIDIFYPVSYYQSSLLYDPGASLANLVTPRTRIVHLWNELLRKNKSSPPAGSPLAEIIDSLDDTATQGAGNR